MHRTNYFWTHAVAISSKGMGPYIFFKMTDTARLRYIKVLHTAIWIFFNVVIGYMLYAVIVNKIDKWLWICYGLIILEGLTLAACKMYCPLTLWARKYSNSEKANFDIYLPNWLAKHNKTIYTSIVVAIAVFTIIRLV